MNLILFTTGFAVTLAAVLNKLHTIIIIFCFRNRFICLFQIAGVNPHYISVLCAVREAFRIRITGYYPLILCLMYVTVCMIKPASPVPKSTGAEIPAMILFSGCCSETHKDQYEKNNACKSMMMSSVTHSSFLMRLSPVSST